MTRKNMKFRADFINCENGTDKILSVCESGMNGEIIHEVIIQRGPKAFDRFDDIRGPRITFDELGLDIAPGPEKIEFSDDTMTIILSESEDIEVDISRLSKSEKQELLTVAKAIYK
jgi:hypothetical protein